MVDSRTVRATFGPGESEAISLSLELRPDRVILSTTRQPDALRRNWA